MTTAQETVRQQPAASSRLHGIMTAYLQSKALFTALELGVFVALEKEPAGVPELAGRLGLEPRPTLALLRALEGLGLVERSGERYRNTEESSAFLVPGKEAYVGAFAEHQNLHFGNFARLPEAIRTNSSITKRVLKQGYSNQGAAAGEGREGTQRLIQGMRVSARLQADQLAAAVTLDGVEHVLDLAGGSGDYAIALAQHHPKLRVTTIDYPAVSELARANVEEAGLSGRVEAQPGDVFSAPLPKCDAILLSHVLDGYGAERAQHLIKRVHDALPAGGRLIIHAHIPSLSTGVFPHLFGLILLANTEEGEVRDADLLATWVGVAGFHDIVTQNISELSGMVTAVK
ncbi:methyltransferase [Streptomyces sp. NPDC019443]|uniref:methyltransferase n=1 Tax=Streptomyces sp. NPDC019443 TaxID=3365061 RepID=UPI003797E685